MRNNNSCFLIFILLIHISNFNTLKFTNSNLELEKQLGIQLQSVQVQSKNFNIGNILTLQNTKVSLPLQNVSTAVEKVTKEDATKDIAREENSTEELETEENKDDENSNEENANDENSKEDHGLLDKFLNQDVQEKKIVETTENLKKIINSQLKSIIN